MARTVAAVKQNVTIIEATEWLNARPGTTVTLPHPTSSFAGQAKVAHVVSFQLVHEKAFGTDMHYDVIALLEVE